MIIKRRRTKHFAVVPNEVLEDRRLSAEARGVLAYLLSRPNDWEVNLVQLRKEFDCGKERIERIMREVIEAGYATREMARSDDGAFAGYDYTITDDAVALPQAENPTTDGDPQAGNPQAGNPSAGNPPTHLEIDSTKDGLNQTKREGAREVEEKPLPDAGRLIELRALSSTAAHDSVADTDAAWRNLSHAERLEAVKRYPEWVATKGARKAIAGLPTYLSERRWTYLSATKATPPEADDGRVPAFSRTWWWCFKVAADGANSAAALTALRIKISGAVSYALPWAVDPTRRTEIDRAAEALGKHPSTGQHALRWRNHYRSLGVEMPIPDKVEWVFLPGHDPPEIGKPMSGLSEADREFAAEGMR